MYNRISIVGGSGSGKSTLANILSEELKLPAVHLDAINYISNWVEIDKDERDKIISNKSAEDKADLIIWLDYSTVTQLKGVIKRYLKTYNKERPEIPGCKERLDFTFIKYVFTYNKKKRPVIADYLKDIPKEKVLVFKKQKDLNKWLKEFTGNNNVLEKLK